MRVFGVAAVSALLIGMAGWAAPAGAQSEAPHINLLSDQPSKTPDEVEADKAKDKAYRESLRKIPDAKASSDPWGGVVLGGTPTPGAGAVLICEISAG